MKITKAVFPVAGLGTRFLPATKASPKEMLPVVDKPLIQYAVEEAIEAGMTELIFVTSHTKRSIEDHFDANFELEAHLKEKNKTELLETLESIIPRGVSCAYVRQAEALGLGHAVLCARPLVNDQPFAVLLADDLIFNPDKGALAQVVKEFENESIIAVQEVLPQHTDRYGIVGLSGNEKKSGVISSIVEKPKPGAAPSNLGVLGRYIFTPAIFDSLKTTGRGAGNEIQLTDAIAKLMQFEKVHAYSITGERFDCGDKLGYLKATFHYAMRHSQLGDAFKTYVARMAGELNA